MQIAFWTANCISRRRSTLWKMQIIYPSFRISDKDDSKFANDLIDVVFKSPWWNSRGIKCVSYFKFRILGCRDYMIHCFLFSYKLQKQMSEILKNISNSLNALVYLWIGLYAIILHRSNYKYISIVAKRNVATLKIYYLLVILSWINVIVYVTMLDAFM